MAKKGVNILLVFSDKKITGIINEKDFMSKFLKMERLPSDVTVSEIMSHSIISVDLNDSLDFSGNLMINNNMSGLPVVNKNCNRVEGLITIFDLLKKGLHLTQHVKPENDEVNHRIRHDIRGALFTLNTSISLLEKTPEKKPQIIEIMKKSTKYVNDILEDWKNNENNIIISDSKK